MGLANFYAIQEQQKKISADTTCNAELEVTSIKYKCTGKADNKTVYF